MEKCQDEKSILLCDVKRYLIKYFRSQHFLLNYHHKPLLTTSNAPTQAQLLMQLHHLSLIWLFS